MLPSLPGHETRWRTLRKPSGNGPIVYWMSRDQRLRDNWALFHTWFRAREAGRPFGVMFCLSPSYSLAGPRHYRFMLQGLKEIIQAAAKANIPFFLLQGEPKEKVPHFLEEWQISQVVTDLDPLREKVVWRSEVLDRCECGFEEVDAHNIVPCWTASPKLEFAAYTFRPKVHLHLPDHLERPPQFSDHPIPWPGEVPEVDMEAAVIRQGNYPEDRWQGGEVAAGRSLSQFLSSRLNGYAEKRNDPNLSWQSDLSPYLHFGMISARSVAIAVNGSSAPVVDKGAFLEELIVRRELSDNFCFYNRKYDQVDGFPSWAKETLREHLRDQRDYVYSEDDLERSRTHDPLWNAAQAQMVREGKMHGWLRMYWAKKILEWSQTPEEALRIALNLNDRYEMDGRDPNGYVGAAWSIGGVHDRAWSERPIFGKVRYMNLNGARRKFDVDQFVSRYAEVKVR